MFDPPTDWITAAPDAPPTWTFLSLPNPEMANSSAFVQVGQTVGGSSAVNGMFFDRGSRFDYDAWTEAGGKEFEKAKVKWNWAGLFPFFKKVSISYRPRVPTYPTDTPQSVTFTKPDPAIAQRYKYTWDLSAYGGSTPIHSSWSSFQWADQTVLGKAWTEIGIKPAKECAGGNKEGICWVPASQHPVTAKRSHAGLGHYADVQPRSNYDLLVNHQVVRVVYRNGPKSGPPLVEVKSLADNHLFNVTVTGEVVLSAGALHTPTILQRSGIGPSSVLAAANIPLVLNLPGVGSNLQDHSGPPVSWTYTKPYQFFPLPSDMLTNATFKAETTALFSQTPARGPYTLAGGNSAIYFSLPHITPAFPTIISKIRAMATSGSSTAYLPSDIRSDPTMAAGYASQLLALANLLSNPSAPSLETPWATSEAPGTAWSFLLHPLSRGTVRLDPADHLAQPVLDYRAGTNPVDFDIHLAHVRYLRKLLDTLTLKGYGAVESAPGAQVAGDDELLKGYVRGASILSFMHPCCTAAMLPREKGGVVGVELKVHGAEGLRVADMSVMPLVPGTHLSATAYAVGEKVSLS